MDPKTLDRNLATELCYFGPEGERKDTGLHEEFLDNPEAEIFSALWSFHNFAMRDGKSIDQALSEAGLSRKDLKSPINAEVVASRRRNKLPSIV